MKTGEKKEKKMGTKNERKKCEFEEKLEMKT